MIVLGLLLILIALGVLLALLFGGADDRADYVVGGLELEVSTMTVFLLGGATVLVFVVGLSMVRSGSRRAAKRRKDQKELDRLSAKLEKKETKAGDPPTPETGPKS
jgi:ABC-type Fe3+ transport system permease subunit